jgi:hypothetical protein
LPMPEDAPVIRAHFLFAGIFNFSRNVRLRF